MVTAYNQPWQLYDLSKDRTEIHDLASSNPQRLQEMLALQKAYQERPDVRLRLNSGEREPEYAPIYKADGSIGPGAKENVESPEASLEAAKKRSQGIQLTESETKSTEKQLEKPKSSPAEGKKRKDPNGPTEFRGTKGGPYEGSLRVSFAVSWPRKIEPGRVSEHVGYFPDVLPTIAQAAGGSLPTDIDGISFLPELIGETAAGGKQQQHEYLYWEHGKWVAIRQGDWRAVDPGKKDWELYNLKTDPSESKNVAADHPEILNKLRALTKQATEPMLAGTYSTRERADRDRRPGKSK